MGHRKSASRRGRLTLPDSIDCPVVLSTCCYAPLLRRFRSGLVFAANDNANTDFLGLTVKGAVLGDEKAEQLPADLVESVRGEVG
jgi:hypothetical protein